MRRIFAMNRLTRFSVAVVVALLLAAPASASSRYTHYYVESLTVGNGIEANGIYYRAIKVPIDNAYCIGLRRYGVQPSRYGLDKFWRFKCTVNGADGHTYTVQLSTWTGPKPRLVYPRYLSVKRLY